VRNNASSCKDGLLCLVDNAIWGVVWIGDDNGFLGLCCGHYDSYEGKDRDNSELHSDAIRVALRLVVGGVLKSERDISGFIVVTNLCRSQASGESERRSRVGRHLP
jgi:hypothetical protein